MIKTETKISWKFEIRFSNQITISFNDYNDDPDNFNEFSNVKEEKYNLIKTQLKNVSKTLYDHWIMSYQEYSHKSDKFIQQSEINVKNHNSRELLKVKNMEIRSKLDYTNNFIKQNNQIIAKDCPTYPCNFIIQRYNNIYLTFL